MRAIFTILLALLGSLAPLAAFSPVLHLINPRGGQRGTEVVVNFHGERLADIAEAIHYQAGISLSNLEIRNPQHVVAKFTIAPDAALGEHSIRLRSPGGLSELRSFWVGQFPNVLEIEPNDSFDQAQRVELNSSVEGISKSEDDDYYVCHLKKGQRLSIEVEAMRLGRTMFDAYLAILDPRKFELASIDDTALLRNDSFASIIAPEDGDYRILIHEAAYEGNENCQYRLHIGSFPRPKAVFPSGGKPGEVVEFTFVGDPAGPIQQSITLPAQAAARFAIFPQQDGLSSPSPHWITVSPLEHFREVPPNHERRLATRAPTTPCAIHGVLDGDSPADWFVFPAKKGQEFVIRVLARSHRSPLDSVLSIHQADGKSLAANDDQGSPDSTLAWTCPADADYHLQLRDQLARTGPDFSYRLEITEKSRALAATLPTVERVNTQKWKTFPVPRGNRYAALINLTRENLSCEATFSAASLPAGVTLHCPPIAKAANAFPIVLEAAPDAPIAGGLHEFLIRSAGDAPALTGQLTDTIHHIDINNQGPYHSASFDRIATAVTSEAPFKIELAASPVPIVKNGTLALKVTAARQPGYTEKITVRSLWNPPGISGPVNIEIPANASEALYEFHASADAAPGTWQLCVLAEAATPEGPVLVSSALTPLEVAEPFVAITLDLAATEQGKPTVMAGKIEILQPFDASASVELIGLPHGASCPPQTFTKDQTELNFPISLSPDAAIGKHNGVFCRVKVPQHGAEILHQTAMGSTLRIDAPSQNTAASPSPTAKPATPNLAPATKPLSRLEQLRQLAK